MFARMREYLFSAAFTDDEFRTHFSKAFKTLLLNMMIVLVLAVPVAMFLSARKQQTTVQLLFYLFMLLTAWDLARRGRIKLASVLFVAGNWAVYTVVVLLFSAGINSIDPIIYVSIAVSAGVLLGPRAAVLAAVLSAMVGLAKTALDVNGYVSPFYRAMPAPMAWVMLVFALILAVIPLNLVLRSFVEALAQARRELEERKKMELRLRESEERYRELFDNANDIMYTHGLEGNLTSLNKAGLRIGGYTIEEALKQKAANLVAPRYRALIQETTSCSISRDESAPYEAALIDKDGREVPVEISTRVMRRDGIPVGIQGTARDITERKRAEEQQHNLEAQLGQAQKMESVGRLAGGVAHDFNNLLMAILGYAEMILAHRQELTPDMREWVEEIQKAGERARDLTRQLLAFGRKQTLEMQVLDMNEVVLGFGKMLKRLIGEDIRVKTLLNPRIGAVKADVAQIEQVLLNLAVNARDAMPNGGRLAIETADVVLDGAYVALHPDVEPGTYVMLAVSDTGCGMDAETQKMAFEPFFTTKGPGQGTGLGLATVYGIVKQHRGHISVYSELGHGTTFKIYLPRITEVAQEETTPSAPVIPIGGTETILLVEDDAAVRGLTCKMLADLGYDVIEADGGTHALSLAAERKTIHLLLTDVIMPEMSGRRISEQVAALHPETKTLYMSGYTANVIAHHGVLDPGVHLLQKPFTNQGMAEKIREVLAG
jgi:two-component system cell cycle sensor histidine kinase/response regulator CckA